MKNNLKIIGRLVLHWSVLVVLPATFIYAVFFTDNFFDQLDCNPTSFADLIEGLFEIVIGFSPAVLGVASLIYLVEGRPLYQYLSFHHTRASVYLDDSVYVYKKVFASLAEIFEKDNYKKAGTANGFAQNTKENQVSYQIYDENIKRTLQVVLRKKEFSIRSVERVPKRSYGVKPKDHDDASYGIYYEELRKKGEEMQIKLREKQQTNYENELEKKKLQEMKIAKKREEEFEALLKAILEMKKRKLEKDQFSIGEETYAVELDHRNILVTKGKDDVYIKCTLVGEKTAVYLNDQEKTYQRTQKNRLTAFYEVYTTKRNKTVS